MEIQPQSSPKRKEPAMEKNLLQPDDLRTILREERQSWKDELKNEFQGWSAAANTSLEKFEGELNQVAGKIKKGQSSVEEMRQQRTVEEGRVNDLDKRMGAIESRSTTLWSHAENDGNQMRRWRPRHWKRPHPWWHS